MNFLPNQKSIESSFSGKMNESGFLLLSLDVGNNRTDIRVPLTAVVLSEEADEVFALLDLLLDFVAGRGDLSLRAEHGADEAEHGAEQRGVKSPAH